jgi:hexosaminidase
MIKSIVLSFLAAFVAMSSIAQYPARPLEGPPVSIVPRPVSFVLSKGRLDLTKRAPFIELTGADVSLSALLEEFLKAKDAEAGRGPGKKGYAVKLTLTPVKNDQLGNEGYKLSVSKKGISLEANAEAGLFYGIQTLIQLTNSNSSFIPYVEITDYPRFGYRGLHLDVCRHIFPVAFVKKYIDLMAKHKFNRFHWHLTDDQGWRMEIKKYPKLQQIAAYRNGTVIGHAGNSNTYDSIRYGGYYTQEEVKEVIAYAAARYVTIIPEIEMPGHAVAAIAAYPELGCRGDQIQTERTFGVFDPIFCAGQENTFTFLEDVLTEVIGLFPGQYIHIGGDEAPKTRWKECPHCQKRIKDNSLKDEHELQSYFINRIEKFVNSKGKQIIGWDEILEGGLAPNATVMSWRGEEGGIAAAKLKHNVIMTPGNWCYFDHLQDTAKTEPLSIGGLTPVREVYTYEPLPAELNADESNYILGAQANLWTEYILTPQHAEYMAYPRACALAEVVWSPKEGRDYLDFLQRMESHLKRLKNWNVNCANHITKEIEYLKNPQTKK